MWFYLNLNFSTFKLGQADLTIIVIEVTQIQTLSAPTRAPGADSLKEKCPLALLPLLTCIVEHDINCSPAPLIEIRWAMNGRSAVSVP